MTTAQQSTSTTPLADQAPSDFDGDGISDILWHNTDGATGVWYMSSTGGSFTPVIYGTSDTSWIPQGTGDFNADGKADILWRNTDGDVGEWLSNPGAGATGFTAVDLQNVDPSWVIQGVGDFNGDGASDILWQNSNSDTGIWYNNGNGFFTAVDLGLIDFNWSVQNIGDFNGDGMSDILWRRADGEVGLWLANGGTGNAGFDKLDLGNVNNSWVTQGVGDFNGDGTSDILWRNTLTGDVGVWYMNPNGSFTTQDLGVVGIDWTIEAVGDYNGDHKADILWRNANGDVGVWLSNPGSGFTGLTASILANNVDPNWSVVGANAPIMATAGSSPAAMAHAMAAMGAHGSGPALVPAVAHDVSTHPMLAVPGLQLA